MGIAESQTKGEENFTSRNKAWCMLVFYLFFFFKQSILWHESDNIEWEDHTPAGCGRAGGAVETAWAHAAGVCSLEGLGETSATKLPLQGYLAAKLVLQKHWDSWALFLHLPINVSLLYLLFQDGDKPQRFISWASWETTSESSWHLLQMENIPKCKILTLFPGHRADSAV